MSTRYSEERGEGERERTSKQSKASQGNDMASLAMSCLALPRGVSPLYRKNKETHLIYRERERGHGMGRGKARQGHGNPRQSKASAPLYREERDSFATEGGEVSLFSIEGMLTSSRYRIESVATPYREGAARQA